VLFLPIAVDLPQWRPALVTLLLVAINVAVFGYMLSLVEIGRCELFTTGRPAAGNCEALYVALGAQEPITAAFRDRFALVAARLFGHTPVPRDALPPWVTLFTCAFLHGSLLHLFGNMLFLWVFGSKVEGALGAVRFLLLYLLCAAAAGVAQAAMMRNATVPMIGASGAVFGVLAAFLVLFPRAMVAMFVWIFVMLRTISVPAWWWIAFFMAAQLLNAASRRPDVPGVAYWAHLGGFGAGIALLLVIFPGWLETRRERLRAGAWR
jgi:membrane associated rhomboid family serine protease